MTEQRGDPGWDDARRSRRDESVWAQAARDDAEGNSPDENGAGRGTPRPDAGRTDQDRTDRDRPARERSGRERRQTRPRQVPPSSDVLSDFQRWLLRNSAKTMRKEITGQVRRTFSGGRQDSGDVWDTATTEIPLGVGEAPECQWCPICRAARRMRDSGPSIGDHLSTAGDAVAAAVQDALGAVDSVLSRASGPPPKAPPPDPWAADGGDWTAARDSWAAAHGARIAGQGAEPSPAVPDEPADEVALDAGPLPAGPDEPADEVAHEVSQQPEGPDEPDNRG
jgi:hypothetical protein